MDLALNHLKKLPFSTILAARNYGMENISVPPDAHNGSKLCMAILRGDNSEVKELLKDDSGINYRSNPDGWTPLIHSIYYNNEHARKILLEHGADIKLADFAGRTPLMFAALRGDIKLLQELLASGADPETVDHLGKTAADFAIEYHQTQCVILLNKWNHKNGGK